jgi:hypothetical protein
MTITIPAFVIPLFVSIVIVGYFSITAQHGDYSPDIGAIFFSIFGVLITWLIYFIIF